MGMPAVHAASTELTVPAAERLRDAGFSLRADTSEATLDSSRRLADALDLAAGTDAVATVVAWADVDRSAAEAELLLAGAAAAAGATSAALGIIVIPAERGPHPGPVIVLSPAESVSAYELYVGAAWAGPERRRVVHFNGRGTRASAVHSGIAARVMVRAAVPEWREFAQARPERALHTLTSRPAAIVAAVPPGSAAAARLISDHPDADVVLVFDRAHARDGAAIAEQVASMVEIAFGLGAHTSAVAPRDPGSLDEALDEPISDAPASAPSDPAPDLPSIQASDVVHVRLTADALEVTNRTGQRLRLRVGLGSAREPEIASAHFETVLEPRTEHSEPTSAVPGLRDLEPPHAVMRHWSHMSEEVYEGGEQRLLAFGVEVLDAQGQVRAAKVFRPGNGFDYFVTARDLTALIGRPTRASVLPEPSPDPASARRPDDVLAALDAALAVGAGILAARHA